MAMTQKQKVLSAAIASCFGMAAGSAFAVVDLTGTTVAGTTKFAKEIPSNTTTLANPANQLDVKIQIPAGYTITGSNPLYVKFDLTNGAKFATANPTLTCDASGAAIDGGGTTGFITIGGLGQSNVVFQVNTTANTATRFGTANCTLTANAAGITISGLNNVNVSATVEYKNGINNVTTGVAGSYITFVRGIVASAYPNASSAVVVDATSGSDNFSAGGASLSQFTAHLGDITIVPVGTSAATATTVGNVAVDDIIGASSGSITVSGPAIAAAIAANGTSGIYLDATTASFCDTKSYTVASSATNSVTFTSITTANMAALSVCANVSGGTTVIGTGKMSATAGGTALSNVTYDLSFADNSLKTLTSNGTTKNAYMINASTSTAKTSVLRIVNTGAVSATFTATAYAVDDGTGAGAAVAGTTLGTANATLGTVANGGALSLTSAQLEQKLGFTPAAGTSKYRIVISAGTDAMEVLNYTKDTGTGAIVLSQSQTN